MHLLLIVIALVAYFPGLYFIANYLGTRSAAKAWATVLGTQRRPIPTKVTRKLKIGIALMVVWLILNVIAVLVA
jgi:hypothetical protein